MSAVLELTAVQLIPYLSAQHIELLLQQGELDCSLFMYNVYVRQLRIDGAEIFHL